MLVVGAGPAGLAAAIELARHGVPVLLVERRTALSSHPRATVLSLRSMELMRAWGLEGAVRERSVDVDWRMLVAETLADAAAGSAVAGRLSEPGAEPRAQPRRARLRGAGRRRAAAAGAPARPARRPRRARRGAHRRLGGAGRRARRAARRAHGRDAHGACALRRRRPTARAARCARALGVALRGAEDVLAGFTTLFRAPLWDVVGAASPPALLGDARASRRAPSCPPARRTAGCSASAAEGGEAPDERRVAELVRLGAGVPGLPVRIERSRQLLLRGAARRALPLRPASSSPATPRTASRRGAGRA